MNYIIRDAVANDMPHVLKLIQELATFEKEPDAVDVTSDELITEGFGENPLFHCFVAEVYNEIVGIALIYFRFSTWKGRTIHLEDLIVKESMRGTGLGKSLYTKVLQYAKTKKVRRVEWAVLDWNKNAIEFYRKSGASILKDWYLVQMDQEQVNTYISRL